MILPFPQFDCHNPLLYVYLAYKLKKITKILDFAGEQVRLKGLYTRDKRLCYGCATFCVGINKGIACFLVTFHSLL